MSTLLIALGAGIFYLIAYHTYGRWLARKIFKLDASASVPAIEMEDGADYVPTKKGIVFGHHFTSIAGTGPIVGPALAVIWGWLPALLWVLLGSVLIGAIHDFGSLVISMRNKGQTVGDIAGRVLHPRARILFLLILFVALTIVLAIFGMVIAAVFRMFPQAIFPCLVQIPIAVCIGIFIHRKGSHLLIPSILALTIMYLSVAFGNAGVIGEINQALSNQSNMWWVCVLLTYSAIASIIPVWTLLQPRDYINSLQLLSALGLVVIGLIVAAFIGGSPINGVRHALEIAAPAVENDFSLKALPNIAPFLFITIACGAISGFHCLVSSGTSSKQLCNERDAQFIGFGSMLTEGMLAVIVILACVAGLGLGAPAIGENSSSELLFGKDIWNNRYGSWASSKGLGAKVGAFVDGSANFLKALGIPASFATALMGVFVASFAATTLDTACRLQRYVVQELFGSLVRKNDTEHKTHVTLLTNKYTATAIAITLALILAAIPVTSGGQMGAGGLILWPLFGATNQLLGGLAFLVIIFWMKRRQLPVWFAVIPAIFMLILPAWALMHQVFINSIDGGPGWLADKKWLLVSIALGSIALEVWLIIEAVIAWKRIHLEQVAVTDSAGSI